jgi:uncharacterized protein DUF4349
VTHRPISELLPWYVNDTLTLEERTAVEDEIDRCAECATEVDQLGALRDYMLETDAAIEGPSQTLFAKTLARIEREEHAPRRVGKLWAALAGLGWLLVAAPVVAAVVVIGFWAFGPGGRFAAPVSAVAPPQQPQMVSLDMSARAVASNAATYPTFKNEAAVSGAPINAVQRDIVRTGAISLVVDDVERAINLADSVASRRGGYVSSLSDQTPQAPGERHSADMQVSVPSAQFDNAMLSLAALGVVRSRSVNAQDVTSNVVDLTARLDNARRTERDLAAIMDRQGKIDDILQAEQQLAQAREQVEQLAGQLQAQQQSVALSTIDLTLTDAAPKPSAAAPSGSDQLGDAWRAAVRSVGAFTLAIVSGALFIMAYVPYIALVVVLAWLAWRRSAGQRPRQRE